MITRRPNLRHGRKRAWRAIKWLLLIVACVVLLPVVIALGRAGIECRPFTSGSAAQTHAESPTPAAIEGYTRPEDQTYLTLPEWYIVYSADEYAAFTAEHRPSEFPYFQAIGQFWQSYYDVCGVTRDQYAFNNGYHLTLSVIGVSFTIENIFKGIYENTFGRIAEWLSFGTRTAEDVYAQRVAAEYGTFLHTIPWYEFPYGEKLRGVWQDTPFWGPGIIRKAERKIALTTEYGTKAAYASLIKLGTRGVFDPQNLEIHARAEGITPEIIQRYPDVRMLERLSDQEAIIVLPRYEAFTERVPQLIEDGVRFHDIAGNDEILITVLASQDWQADVGDAQQLFAMPILTQPDQQRVAIRVPVPSLHAVLQALDRADVTLEHIYDY